VRRMQNIGDASTSGLELEAKFRLDQLIDGATAVELRSNLSLYRSRVASVPGPKIVVVQDLDKPLTYGAGWGEVISNLHRALDCVGVIVDGAIRDLDEMCYAGFKALARRLCVSHCHAWPVRWGCEVEVFGTTVKPGQLIHADKHGFVAVPFGEEKKLLEAARFMDTNECMTMIPSGRAAILAYMMPAWAIPLSVWLVGERLTGAKLAGLALGMGGLALLLVEALATLGSAPLGSLLVLGASLSWALGTVLQKRYPMNMPSGPYTAWIMLLGGIPIFIGALLLDDFRGLGSVGLWPALAVAYNVLIAFAWAHWAWIKIATSVPVTVFSLSMLVIPVVGVMSGMLFLGERPSWAEYTALGLVLASLLTVILPSRQTR